VSARWTEADLAATKCRIVNAALRKISGPVKSSTSKFGNEKTRGFDSKHEAKCARVLQLRESAGEITNLRYQVPFELIPVQRDAAGKLLERSCVYVADFTYWEREGIKSTYVVADAKGHINRVWIIKRKLMLFLKGIRVREL
jgi:hypothetical protein